MRTYDVYPWINHNCLRPAAFFCSQSDHISCYRNSRVRFSWRCVSIRCSCLIPFFRFIIYLHFLPRAHVPSSFLLPCANAKSVTYFALRDLFLSRRRENLFLCNVATFDIGVELSNLNIENTIESMQSIFY